MQDSGDRRRRGRRLFFGAAGAGRRRGDGCGAQRLRGCFARGLRGGKHRRRFSVHAGGGAEACVGVRGRGGLHHSGGEGAAGGGCGRAAESRRAFVKEHDRVDPERDRYRTEGRGIIPRQPAAEHGRLHRCFASGAGPGVAPGQRRAEDGRLSGRNQRGGAASCRAVRGGEGQMRALRGHRFRPLEQAALESAVQPGFGAGRWRDDEADDAARRARRALPGADAGGHRSRERVRRGADGGERRSADRIYPELPGV